MYRPFVCKIIPPQATICSYIPLVSIPLQSKVHSKSATVSNQKGQGKAGESATLSPKIPGNRPTPVSASLHQPLPLIISYLRYVLVVCFALAVALCSPSVSSVLILIIPQVSQRGHTCPCRCITTAYSSNSQTASHCKQIYRDIHKPTAPS